MKTKTTKPLYEIEDDVNVTDKDSYLNEKNFFKRIKKRTKSFFKNSFKKIKRNAKNIWNALKNDFVQPKSVDKFQPGTMVAFTYDAKFKDNTIWDKKPLIICLGWSQNPKYKTKNFYGLNMHHLHPKDRVAIATFFAELSKKKGGITYKDVKPFMYKFANSPRPVLRQYIYKRVKGQVIKMPTEQFLVAAAIPSEQIIRG